MNHSQLWLMVSAAIALSGGSVAAELPCPADEQGKQQRCQRPEWRAKASMVDDSQIHYVDVTENSERQLPRATVNLWALPAIPRSSSEAYAVTELREVEMEIAISPPQFASSKAELNAAMIKSVATLVDKLKEKQGVRLHFKGHTDSRSLSLPVRLLFKDNPGLSVARAQAVANYFKSALNLSDDAIMVSGMGASEPIASNATAQGMARNRRVEMEIWYDEVSPGVATVNNEPTMNRQQVCAGGVLPVSSAAGGFRVSVDGQSVARGVHEGEDVQRCTDVALANADIRLQYDNLLTKPLLNVNAWPATAVAGEMVSFRGYSNYQAWIDRAEVRLFAEARSVYGEPLAIVPLNNALQGEWQLPDELPRTVRYLIRVYDKEGRFDETSVLPLFRVDAHKLPEDEPLTTQQGELIAYGNSRLERQKIPVRGGSITVHGSGIPPSHQVMLMGWPVPVAANGQFVARQIIPHGRHTIEVAALDPQGNGTLFWRDLELKSDDWFHVGLIDLTAGRYRTNGDAYELTQDSHLDGSGFVDGRLAFYSKGKWRDKYTITASADSREQPINELFSTIMDKDPRSLLRRLDSSAYYPVYGDDSTLIEDAPTQGKFYARIEDERSHAMWGNFKIVQQETDLAQINRGLYGAVIDWKSAAFVSDSRSKARVNLFAAEPGTQAAYEEFRGTGGSLYYLQHQDIVAGSERVQVEVRDKDSGIVLSVKTLVAGEDYQEDAIQGRIVLIQPLSASANDNQLVRSGSDSGHPVYLVVNYEYVGNMTDFDDLALGGRATYWLNDSVRLGATGSRQQVANEEQNLNGIDLLIRKTPETYLRLETARTEGSGITGNRSIDGGFNFSPVAIPLATDSSANAYQLESGFRLNDIGLEMDGNGHFYARRRQDGFSAPGQLVNYDTDQYGGGLTLPLTEQLRVDLKFDATNQDGGIDSDAVEVDVRHDVGDNWMISAGLRTESRQNDTGTAIINGDGERTDLTLQADYGVNSDWGVYGFGQGTLSRTGDRNTNNRGGIGGHYSVNDRLRMKGEASAGDGGVGLLVGSDYRLSERTTTYLNYALNPDNANSGVGNRQGKLVSGMRHRYSDWVSAYGEEQYLHGGNGDGLIHAYGVDLTPNESWKFGLALESGEIATVSSITTRRAASLAVNYGKDAVKYGGKLEFRHDETDGSHHNTWLTRNNLGYQVNPDWRLRLQLDLAFSDSGDGEFFDADYIETLIGYAYRPINGDKFNALLEYKYLADQAPSEQFSASGQQNELQQRSHVFAVDGIYDLTPRWSLGGKYAIRVGELRDGRGAGEWYRSQAQLAITRLDWHVVKYWDALIEARLLNVKEAGDTRAGALLAIYRHIGAHFKVGAGYNYTDFSADLTDLDYDSRGAFFNLIGKW